VGRTDGDAKGDTSRYRLCWLCMVAVEEQTVFGAVGRLGHLNGKVAWVHVGHDAVVWLHREEAPEANGQEWSSCKERS